MSDDEFSYLVGQRIANAYTGGHVYTAGINNNEIPEDYKPIEDEDAFETVIEHEVREVLRTDYKDLDRVWRDIKDDIQVSVEDNRVRFTYKPADVLEHYGME